MDENRIYARWLSVGVGVGFAALLASFVLYLTRLLPRDRVVSRLLENVWARLTAG